MFYLELQTIRRNRVNWIFGTLHYRIMPIKVKMHYYSIDTHDMLGNYLEDDGDDGNSVAYKGKFNTDWQNANKKGLDWYENKLSPGC